MPRYELMYILASSVSDDIVPETTAQVEQLVADFGATNIKHTQLGKKKLAYPIKKTRNGNYGVIEFDMDSTKVNPLDAKIRTQGKIIIRHIIVNLEEYLTRLEKDKIAQAKMNRNRPADAMPENQESSAEADVKKTDLQKSAQNPESSEPKIEDTPAPEDSTSYTPSIEAEKESASLQPASNEQDNLQNESEPKKKSSAKKSDLTDLDAEIEKALNEDLTK